MSISDSSSRAERTSRFIRASFLAVGALVVLLEIKLTISKISMSGYRPWAKVRFEQALAGLQLATADLDSGKSIVLFFGNSDIETAVSPMQIETAVGNDGIDIRAYNFGVRYIGPDVVLRLVNVLVKDVRRTGKKIDAVVFQFVPFFATRAYRQSSEKVRLDISASALSFDSLWMEVRNKPHLSIEMAFEGLLSKLSTDGFATASNAYRLRRALEQLFGLEGVDSFITLWNHPSLHQGAAWDPSTRGEFYFSMPESASTFHRFAPDDGSAPLLEPSLNYFDVNYDFTDLRLDSDLVEINQIIVERLASIAKKVVLTKMPYRPGTVRRSEAALKRLDAAEAVVEHRDRPLPNVSIIDYSKRPEFNERDFIDLHHMSVSGRNKINSMLASDISKIMKELTEGE